MKETGITHPSGVDILFFRRPDAWFLVGKFFIDIADIYCFGTGLPISRSNHIFQYCHFKIHCKLTLLIFEIKQKSEDIVHFYLTFLKFSMCF